MPTDADEAALGLLGLTAGSPLDIAPTIPLKRKQPSSAADDDAPSNESISCICGFTYDDGFSIGCDSCQRWCHAACFGIVESQVPETWECWLCDPRPVDKDRAVKLQRARQKSALNSYGERERVAARRRLSPGVERKPRKPSALDGSKRKRRASINVSHHGEDEHVDIDEPWALSYVPLDRDIVPSEDVRDRLKRVAARWRGVTAIEPESMASPPQITLSQLPPSSLSPSFLDGVNHSVRPPSYAVHAATPILSSRFISPFTSTIIPSTAYLSDPLNAYAHLGMPKPFVHLFGPPLDVALDARTTGDQARFVRSGCRPNAVLRPMICKGKNGGSAEGRTLKFGLFALRDLKPNEEIILGWEWDDGNVIHHLPALIESPQSFPAAQIAHFRLQMTSMLHALSSTFTTCACGAAAKDCALTRMAAFVDAHTPPTPSPSPPTSHHNYHNGGHANGDRQSSDELEAVHEDRDSQVDLGPLIGVQRGFRTREKVPMSGGMGGVEMVPPPIEGGSRLPPTPSPGRVFKSSSKKQKGAAPPALSRRIVSEPSEPSSARMGVKGKDVKGKAKASAEEIEAMEADPPRRMRRVTIDVPLAVPSAAGTRRHASPAPVDVDMPPKEECLPPKMRKAWMHRSFEALKATAHASHKSTEDAAWEAGVRKEGRETSSDEDMELDKASLDAIQMPPPPVPPPHRAPPSTPTTPDSPSGQPRPLPAPHLPLLSFPNAISHTVDPPIAPAAGPLSPSVAFANLSLLSPAIPGPSVSLSANSARCSTSPLASSDLASTPATPLTPVSPEPAGAAPSSTATASTVNSVVASALSPRSPVLDLKEQHVAGSLSTVHGSDDPLSSPQNNWPEVTPLPAPTPEATSETRVDTSCGADESMTPGRASSPMDSVSDAPSVIPPPAPDAAGSPLSCVPNPHTSPPTPPPKVKLSLKDFAARKKKQRGGDARASSSPKEEAIPLATIHVSEGPSLQSTDDVVAQQRAAVLSTAPIHTTEEDVTMLDVGTSPPPEPTSVDPVQDQKTVSQEVLLGPASMSSCQPVSEALSDAVSLQAKIEVLETCLPERNEGQDDGRSWPLRSSPRPSRAVSPQEKTVAIGLLSRPRSPLRSRSNSRGPSRDLPPHFSHRRPTPARSPTRSRSPLSSRSRSPTPPVTMSQSHSLRRPQSELLRQRSFGQEDGEICSPPPAKAPPQAPRHPLGPPTQPRLFLPPTASLRMPTPPRRPLQPTHPAQNATNPYDGRMSRPNPFSPRLANGPRGPRSLPSAPRALRAANNGAAYGALPTGPSSPIPPRGPNASSDREWLARRGRPMVPPPAPRREWPRLRSPG